MASSASGRSDGGSSSRAADRLAALVSQLGTSATNAPSAATGGPAKVGGAVLLQPAAPAPVQLSLRSVDAAVTLTTSYPPFEKTLLSCGLRLIAFADVDDEFVMEVGRAAAAMLDCTVPEIDRERCVAAASNAEFKLECYVICSRTVQPGPTQGFPV